MKREPKRQTLGLAKETLMSETPIDDPLSTASAAPLPTPLATHVAKSLLVGRRVRSPFLWLGVLLLGAALLSVLRKQVRQGVTVLFTTHDPNLVASTSDYVMLMCQGAVLAAGPMDETLTAENLSMTYVRHPRSVVRLGERLFVIS